jgi:hypothetical protein
MNVMDLVEAFNLSLASERVQGPITYRVELAALAGSPRASGQPSTRQVRLVPEGGGTTPGDIVVAGAANQAEGWAELRSFAHVQRLHAQHGQGAELPLNRVQYDALLDKLRAFFADHACTVRMAELPTAKGAAIATRATSGTLVLALILGLAAAAATAVVWFFLHR